MKKFAGAGCLVLFALPFAGVGVFMTGLTVKTLWSSSRMQDWEEVPAEIVHAELKVNRGDDSTSYRAIARYTYVYDGRDFSGDKVSVHGGGDNIGSFQQDAHAELQSHLAAGTPFRCYVDPSAPEQSVLYREVRWGLILLYATFGLVFGAVGFGLIGGSIWARRRVKEEEARKEQHPDEPWLWEEGAPDGIIKSSNKAQMASALIFAFFWNAISLPVAFFIVPAEVIDKGNRLALIALVFPAVGMGLLVWAIRCVARWRKFGESVFRMASVPGVIGGALAGAVSVPVHLRPADGYPVSLTCIRRTTSGSGKNRHTTEHVLWQDERYMARELLENDSTQTAIPVLFHIPFDAQQTTPQEGSSCVLWRLEVRAKVPGIDYVSQFEVPVYRTEASSADFQLDESKIALYEAKQDPIAAAAGERIRVEKMMSGGVRVTFPAARHLGSSAMLAAFLAIWTGAFVLMIRLGAPFIFPVIFGLIDILLVACLLDMLFWSNRVEATRELVTAYGGILGIGPTRVIPSADVASFDVARGMQSGNKLYYSLKVKTQTGRTYTLGKRVGSKRQAEALTDRLYAATGKEKGKGAGT